MRTLAAPLLLLALTGGAAAGDGDAAAARLLRRSRLAARIGDGYAFLFGQPLTDVLQPPQEGSFLYLAGIEDPDAALLLVGAARPAAVFPGDPPPPPLREALFLRDGGEWYARFFGWTRAPGDEAARELRVEAVKAAPRDPAAYAPLLAALLPQKARLLIPPYRSPDHATLRLLRDAMLAQLAKLRPDVEVGDLQPHLTEMRCVKDAVEIAALRRAAEVTVESFREAAAALRAGGTEAALDGALIAAMRTRQARPAYGFVVAAGAHGAVPHYFRNDGPLRGGDLVVIDAAAQWDRYAADVTRTWPVSGRFTARQRELYGIVLEAQEAAIAAVRPGATLADVDRAARERIARAGLAKDFLHRTSHHVGLDVHDPGGETLQPGMVFTIEPGIYLPAEKLGIRIEDTVLVTESGAEVLSAALPRKVEEIEAMLRRAR